jgi:hypothetical protein
MDRENAFIISRAIRETFQSRFDCQVAMSETIKASDLYCTECEFMWISKCGENIKKVSKRNEFSICQLCAAEHALRWEPKEVHEDLCYLFSFKDTLKKDFWIPVFRILREPWLCCRCNDEKSREQNLQNQYLPYYSYIEIPEHLLCKTCYNGDGNFPEDFTMCRTECKLDEHLEYKKGEYERKGIYEYP